MLRLDVAIAEYLGLSRLEAASRADDSVDEDLFCDRLRLLGAKWWESEESYVSKVIELEDMTPLEKQKMEGEMLVGWPGTVDEGVWILRVTGNRDYPQEGAMLRMCVSMTERCILLERWGAVFYEDPRDVVEFAAVLGNKI